MRAALVVNRVRPSVEANLWAVERKAYAAADQGADLVVFSEMALTGFIVNDDPAHDFPLAQTVPGPITERLARVCAERAVWVAVGLLERDGDCLYDAAVLLGPTGDIVGTYRRVQPSWHGPGADQAIYRQGDLVGRIATPFGGCTFLICGDLFEDALLERVRAARPDLLMVPIARGFDEDVADLWHWERSEQFEYSRRVALAGAPALITNSLDDTGALGGGFGGAMAVAADGEIVEHLPLHREGMLLVELGDVRGSLARDGRT